MKNEGNGGISKRKDSDSVEDHALLVFFGTFFIGEIFFRQKQVFYAERRSVDSPDVRAPDRSGWKAKKGAKHNRQLY